MTIRLRLTLLLFFTATSLIQAQIPDGFSYQAILRDADSKEIINTNVNIKFGIYSGSETGTLIWEEEHTTTTSSIGLFSLVLGDGARTGGTLANFTDISWATSSIYLKVSVQIAGTWSYFDPVAMISVPYALTAKKSLDNPFSMSSDTVSLLSGSLSIGSATPGKSKLSITSQNDLSEDALFEVRRSDGQSIFAVFNEGVQINIPLDPTVKGPRGGFAIGGFDKNKGIIDQFMVINSDSTRIYIDDSSLKGPRGGFAIGGFDRTKTYRQDYIYVAPDSTRIYVENQAKGPRGGFAIGGFDRTKGDIYNFLDLTPENYFIGHESGSGNTTGQFNTFIGYQAGKFNTEGKWNLFMGTESGLSNTTGYMNTFVGNSTGNSNINGFANVFLGTSAGVTNESGSFNTFIGSNAGLRNFDGNENVFIGPNAAYENTYGGQNLIIGSSSGYNNTTGNANVFLGWRAGHNYTTGVYNIFIGTEAGYGSSVGTATGSHNIFLGFHAGHINSGGALNVMLGNRSGEVNSSGNANTFLGAGSGLTNTSGLSNVFVGYNSGAGFTTGYNNVIVGAHEADNTPTTASNNIFLGGYAGENETSSNRLYIEPSSADMNNALIYGEFDNDLLRVNGKLEVTGNLELATGYVGVGTSSPGYRFDVQTTNSGGFVQSIKNNGATYLSHGLRVQAGSNSTQGAYLIRFYRPDNTAIGGIVQSPTTGISLVTTSDERLKENIETTSFGLDQLLGIRVVDFNYINDPIRQTQTGFLAQQLYEKFPMAVSLPASNDDLWMVDYSRLTPLLVKAVQEQNIEIELLREELITIRRENQYLLERMEAIEALLLYK
jgi:hypothetical protein